jgi:hypothetical protein
MLPTGLMVCSACDFALKPLPPDLRLQAFDKLEASNDLRQCNPSRIALFVRLLAKQLHFHARAAIHFYLVECAVFKMQFKPNAGRGGLPVNPTKHAMSNLNRAVSSHFIKVPMLIFLQRSCGQKNRLRTLRTGTLIERQKGSIDYQLAPVPVQNAENSRIAAFARWTRQFKRRLSVSQQKCCLELKVSQLPKSSEAGNPSSKESPDRCNGDHPLLYGAAIPFTGMFPQHSANIFRMDGQQNNGRERQKGQDGNEETAVVHQKHQLPCKRRIQTGCVLCVSFVKYIIAIIGSEGWT